MEIDYKDLLIKYIQHLNDVEGYDFTEKVNERSQGIQFSHDEVKALLQASWDAKYSPNYR